MKVPCAADFFSIQALWKKKSRCSWGIIALARLLMAVDREAYDC